MNPLPTDDELMERAKAAFRERGNHWTYVEREAEWLKPRGIIAMIQRHRAEVITLRADLARAKGELQEAKADIRRRLGEIEFLYIELQRMEDGLLMRDLKAEIGRLKDDLQEARNNLRWHRAEAERLRAELHGMQDGSLLRDLKAEVERLKDGHVKMNEAVCQSLGKALGYPWYKDDQKSFPGATEADGVCVGEHVAESLAAEAATAIRRLRRERDEARRCAEDWQRVCEFVSRRTAAAAVAHQKAPEQSA